MTRLFWLTFLLGEIDYRLPIYIWQFNAALLTGLLEFVRVKNYFNYQLLLRNITASIDTGIIKYITNICITVSKSSHISL